MQISQKGIDLIKKFEGCILQAYDDYNGKVVKGTDKIIGTLTIGYGHTKGVYVGQTITSEQAEQMLKDDLISYSASVQALIDNGTIEFKLNQNQFDSLVSFAFNLGSGCVVQLCRGRNSDEVSQHITAYCNAGGVKVQGLVNRRNAEKQLFLTPCENQENVSRETFKTYTVQKGDNLTIIANKFNITLANLIQINSIKNPNLIYVGQVLNIGTQKYYTVVAGDTLNNIAIRLKTTTLYLAKMNDIKDINKIYVGQVLKY